MAQPPNVVPLYLRPHDPAQIRPPGYPACPLIRPITSAAEVADLLVETPAAGVLPLRTLIVPGGRYFHGVRKVLHVRERHDVLAGLDGVTAVELARRILRTAGVAFSEGEEETRATRIDWRLAQGHVPTGFAADAILRARGWELAFARIIGELEASDLRPADLETLDDPRTHGVAELWTALDEDAGDRWTAARILEEATRRVVDDHAWRADGPVIAVVTAETTVVELRLLAALPEVTLAVQRARPADDIVTRRFTQILGAQAAAALNSEPVIEGTSALARLQRGPTATSPKPGLDASLTLEQHAGVDREVDAAARWVAERIHDGVPLEEIAVLSAERDPYPAMLYDRILAIDTQTPLAVHVAGGLPISALGGGARIARVLQALSDRLSARAMWRLLPFLRLVDDPTGPKAGRAMSRSQAFEVAYGLGTAGGHPVAPARARDWPIRVRAGIDRLRLRLAEAPVEGKAAMQRSRDERLLQRLQRVLPAIDALDVAMAAVLNDRSLDDLVTALKTLLSKHVASGSMQAGNLLFGLIESAEVPEHVTGVRALDHLIDRASRLRSPTCRFGDPAVFVGSLAHASGLRFSAVRIVGLSEGTVPARVRPDVILGEAARLQLDLAVHAKSVRRRYEAALMTATDRLVLSCPRVALDRATRAASPVFSEAIAAVCDVDDPLAAMEAAFRDSHAASEAAVVALPLRSAERLDRSAVTMKHPVGWEHGRAAGLLDIEEAENTDGVLRPRDGGIGEVPHWTSPPGLAPDNPISASRLGTLLACPFRFLSMHGLYWREPLSTPEPSELSPMEFGTTIHTCVELFFNAHGGRFEARTGAIEDFHALSEPVVDEVFAKLREDHMLENDEAWNTERVRARDHMRSFLEHEWERRAGRWIAAERPFGYAPEPAVELQTRAGPIWVRGDIDRLRETKSDDGEKIIEVWDVKSGKNKGIVTARTEPDVGIDLQIGLYTLVARALHKQWKVPATTAAGYVHTNHVKGPERYFDATRGDDLAEATRRWLGVARELLDAGQFPRTPVQSDCDYCHLKRACGPGATLRSARLLRHAKGGLRSFALLKGVEVEEGEGGS